MIGQKVGNISSWIQLWRILLFQPTLLNYRDAVAQRFPTLENTLTLFSFITVIGWLLRIFYILVDTREMTTHILFYSVVATVELLINPIVFAAIAHFSGRLFGGTGQFNQILKIDLVVYISIYLIISILNIVFAVANIGWAFRPVLIILLSSYFIYSIIALMAVHHLNTHRSIAAGIIGLTLFIIFVVFLTSTFGILNGVFELRSA